MTGSLPGCNSDTLPDFLVMESGRYYISFQIYIMGLELILGMEGGDMAGLKVDSSLTESRRRYIDQRLLPCSNSDTVANLLVMDDGDMTSVISLIS